METIKKLIITCNNNAHTGKSTALREVYNLLLAKGYEVINIAGPDANTAKPDVKAIFTIGGHSVGIETMGDNPHCDVHEQSLYDFLRAGCDIIITASRLRGATRTNVRSFYQTNAFCAVWMKHDYTRLTYLQSVLNKRYAERVVRLVEEWLCGAYWKATNFE